MSAPSQVLGEADAQTAKVERMAGLVCGFIGSQIVCTIAQLSIADLLAKGPATAAEVATAVKANEDATQRLLRAAVPLGLLRVDDDGRFHSTELLSVLEAESPVSMRGFSIIMGSKVSSSHPATHHSTPSFTCGAPLHASLIRCIAPLPL